MPKIDLRKDPAVAPATQPTKDWAQESEVSERERKMLMTTGWKIGDKIPRPLLEAIRSDLEKADIVTQNVNNVKDVVTDIKDLPPEERKRINDAIAGAKEARVEISRIGGDTAGLEGVLDPSIVAAMSAEELIDKKKKALNEEYKNKISEKPLEGKATDAGGEQPLTNCPHCGWNCSKSDDTEITDADKWTFIQSVLGGKRFTEHYDLYDGRLIIVFRTLTNDEADLAFTQTALDVQKNVMPDEGVYSRTLMDYRLCMSIESIKSDQGVITVPDVLGSDFQTDTPSKGMTKLCFIVPYIYENVLKTESIRRSIGATFYRFQRMVEKLEARADDPDFWRATARPV